MLARTKKLSQQNIFAAIKDKYFVATGVIFVVAKNMFVMTGFVVTKIYFS